MNNLIGPGDTGAHSRCTGALGVWMATILTMGSLMLCLHPYLNILSPRLGVLTLWPWSVFRTRRCFLKASAKRLRGCSTSKSTRGENQKWLPHPCLLGGPKEGGNATSPLHSRGSATPSAGRKSEVAASPLPSWGPKRGRKCYVTPAFSGVRNAKRREKINSGYLRNK